jgi:hypothetical protein
VAVLGQESGIVGTVTDPSGAVLTGVNVTAKNVNTGETRQATTDGSGQYAIPSVKSGTYDVSAEKQGFQRKLVGQVTLEVQAIRTIDLVLPPGAVSELVNVTAAPTALQTTDSSVSTLLETKVVNEIPLNGRNFLQLQLLAPGVTLAKGSTFSAVKIDAQSTSIGGGNVSVNGMRDVYNDYLLDGVSFKDWIHGTNGFNPSVDAIQEFRVQTSNYTAEFGANTGGLSNLVTKSGTNVLHGTLYDFFRNDKLDATNFFTKKAGGSKLPLRRNQFGGTVGGPIIRDKTFFFGSYEGFREQRTTTLFDTFPTAPMHRGDFSELLALPTPIQIHDPLGNPYPGNIITPADILSVMPGYLDTYVPLPNRPGLSNNYVTPGTRSNSINQFIGRFDHSLKTNLQLSAHYTYNKINDNPPTTNPNFFIKQLNSNHNVNVQLTDALSPTTVVELRAGYNLFRQFVNKNRAGTTPNIAKDILGISGVASDARASDAPTFITPGFGTLGGFHFGPRQWFSERYEYQGNVSLVRGKHLIRAGLQTVRHHETFPEIFIANGLYVFDGSFTGYPMADMLLGIPQNFELSPELFDPQYRQWEIMPWVQDDWRMTPRLTLNIGLRYEYRPWPVSKNNSISNIVLPPGGGQASLVLAGPCTPQLPVRPCASSLPSSISGTRSTIANTDGNNFAPRVGFAYRVGNSDRTVVRGGYGVFYQPEPFNQFIFLSINPPFVSFYNRFINTSNYQNWDWFNPTAGLPPGGVQFTYIPRNARTPYLQSWNFGVQHDVGAGVVLDVSYVGNKDTKLWARTWPNQPTPGPGDVDSRRPYTNVSTVAGNEPIGNANYHALQVRADRRFSKGLSILGAYTWSKAITDTQGAETGAFVPDLQDNRNRRANRGLWSADARHRFTLSSVYELPFGRNERYLSDVHGAIGKIVSGWQVATIVTIQSGQPLTATLPFDNPNVGEGAKLPDMLRNPNHGPRTADKWFDTAAFATPAPFAFGNEGIGAITSPGISSVDFSLVKNTRLTERMNLQFRAEAFNAANHTLLGDPDTTFGSPTFGTINSTRLDNREIQLALRLLF